MFIKGGIKLKLTSVKQNSVHQLQNIRFSGGLVENDELSRFRNLDTYAWDHFEKSDYMKLLNSDLCSGTYSIEQVDYYFCPGYEPSTSKYFALYKNGQPYTCQKASITYSSRGVRHNIEHFVDSFKNAIIRDVLETNNK